MQVFGHESARRALEEHLPQVTLLRGPASVGKWTLAQYAAQFHGVMPADQLWFPELGVENSRDLKQFASKAPFGKFKFVGARLDGASPSALNALLKLLEEPPPTIVFVLVTSLPTLDTIASRSHVHQLGFLSSDEISGVLTARMGMSFESVGELLPFARGQVAPLLARESVDQARASVLTVLRALKDKDRELLEAGAAQWDAASQDMLKVWCVEALTQRWSVFSESETFGLLDSPLYPLRVLMAMNISPRPKLSVRVLLEPLMA